MTVALVDDDASLRDAVSLWLGDHWPVHAFETAEHFLEQFAVGTVKPSCLIVDHQLPGISGIEMMQRLMNKGQHIPTIFLTAYPVSNLSDRLSGQVFQQLLKPISGTELVSTVQQTLAAKVERSD